ncbi:DUF192 domain-containing protein [candidate division WWE3 bacterium]|jgi:uncharacterized protein|nr:DUF192 domain-containing protein [candidate division WWE3 bacterium]MBT7350247.1 DUF192 domain-containing protein [candidate division WWE3 bacterium]
MAKTVILATLFATIIFTAFALYTIKKGREYNPASVEINGHIVYVEVANSTTSRAKGLMYKDYLGPEEGMFFVFPTEDKHRFWMANTYIPLDIIWISSDNRIVHIEENVPSCDKTGKLQALCITYKPDKNAKFVLEVNAGWSQEKGISLGDVVKMISE